jgi:hypothetical protein
MARSSGAKRSRLSTYPRKPRTLPKMQTAYALAQFAGPIFGRRNRDERLPLRAMGPLYSGAARECGCLASGPMFGAPQITAR